MYYNKKEFKDFISKSYVSISITETLKDFIVEKNIDFNYKKRLAFLTDEESIVLKTIRQDDMKSVIIKFDSNNKICWKKLKKRRLIKLPDFLN